MNGSRMSSVPRISTESEKTPTDPEKFTPTGIQRLEAKFDLVRKGLSEVFDETHANTHAIGRLTVEVAEVKAAAKDLFLRADGFRKELDSVDDLTGDEVRHALRDEKLKSYERAQELEQRDRQDQVTQRRLAMWAVVSGLAIAGISAGFVELLHHLH